MLARAQYKEEQVVMSIHDKEADTPTTVPSIGGDRARLRGGVKEDVLLDTNEQEESTGMESVLGSQDTIEPDSSTPPDDREGLYDVSHLLAKISAYTASQPPTERHAGQTNVEQSNNLVTLGITAGPSQGGGKGLTGSTQRCTQTRSGVCSVHGPGAKWCWEPIPVGRRKPGPNGKLITKKYLWKCEVSRSGKMMRQTRLSFGRSIEDENKRDNTGSNTETNSEG